MSSTEIDTDRYGLFGLESLSHGIDVNAEAAVAKSRVHRVRPALRDHDLSGHCVIDASVLSRSRFGHLGKATTLGTLAAASVASIYDVILSEERSNSSINAANWVILSGHGDAEASTELCVTLPSSAPDYSSWLLLNSVSYFSEVISAPSLPAAQVCDEATSRLNQLRVKYPELRSQFEEALTFMRRLPTRIARPKVWTDGEGEVGLEWIAEKRHAVVSFQGEGEFGYAMEEGDRVVPGRFPGVIDSAIPSDLLSYLDEIR